MKLTRGESLWVGYIIGQAYLSFPFSRQNQRPKAIRARAIKTGEGDESNDDDDEMMMMMMKAINKSESHGEE